jgi:hypothetical protein
MYVPVKARSDAALSGPARAAGLDPIVSVRTRMGRLLALAPALKLATTATVLLLGFVLCRRGIVLGDEGYLLLQSYDLLHGKVLYRDLDAFVAPGVWFLLASLFAIVKPSVLVSRGLALACYFATALVIYRIVKRISGDRYAIAAALAYCVFSIWAFPAWTFSFYSPYSSLFALCALESLLTWADRGRRVDLLGAGIAVGLTMLFKQNYGAFAALAVALGVFAISVDRSRGFAQGLGHTILAGLWIVAGTLAALLPAVGYFAYHGALPDAFHALAVAPFTEFATRHAIQYLPLRELWSNTLLVGANRLMYGAYPLSNDTGYLTTVGPLHRDLLARLHVLAYWLPPLAMAAAAVLALRKRDGGTRDTRVLCVAAMAAGIFLGVFPRADYTHLMHVYQPIIPLAAIVTERLSARARKTRPFLAAAFPAGAATVLLLYAYVAAGWCTDLMRTHSARVVTQRGGVILPPLQADMLNYEVGALDTLTAPGEPVLTLPALSMLNFLADRPVPGKYYNLYGVHIAHDQGQGVVDAAESQRVNWVVAHYYNFFSDAGAMSTFAPRLIDYVRSTFRFERSIGTDTHMFMKRRPTPLPAATPLDLHAQCDVSRSIVGDRAVVPELLFDGLYHMHGKNHVAGMSRRDTTCVVPAGAGTTLYFMLDYRRPSEIVQPSRVGVKVWALSAADVRSGKVTLPDDLDSGRVKPRFSSDTDLTVPDGWASPAPSEHALDIGDLGGDEVLVVLSSTFEGEIEARPYDYRGFGVAWQDLRVGGPELVAAVRRANGGS